MNYCKILEGAPERVKSKNHMQHAFRAGVRVDDAVYISNYNAAFGKSLNFVMMIVLKLFISMHIVQSSFGFTFHVYINCCCCCCLRVYCTLYTV